MDTLQEALFRAMLNDGWFTDSDGNVESPTGYFGYVVNSRNDWNDEFYSAFGDTIAAYVGDTFSTPDYAENWIRNNFCGVFVARIDSNGIVTIRKVGEYKRTVGVPVLGIEITPVVAEAQKWFRDATESYNEWDAN